jgi:hypothetical protein
MWYNKQVMSTIIKKYSKNVYIITTILVCVFLVITLSACSGNAVEPDPSPSVEPPTPSPTPSTPTPTPTPVELVPWNGPVEHIFFHEIIAWPELTFRGGTRQPGFDAEFVTANEFRLILQSLYDNDFVLIDLNDVWSEYTNETNQLRMTRNTLMIPEGKKPLVISFDDMNFYAIDIPYGLMSTYIIGTDGQIWAEGYDPSGNYITSQDLAAITILDKFVRENPGFSHNGAKGCIALTGFEGILGYSTQNDPNNTTQSFRLNRMQEIARVKPVVDRLKATGWYFASHSYGHIGIANASLARVQADGERWLDEVGSIVGDTKIFIYPFGQRLDGADQNAPGPALRFYAEELGFRLFASVGREPYTQIKESIPAVIMDRMLVGGRTLRNSRDRYLRFFDAADVFEIDVRPTDYGTDWGDSSYNDD